MDNRPQNVYFKLLTKHKGPFIFLLCIIFAPFSHAFGQAATVDSFRVNPSSIQIDSGNTGDNSLHRSKTDTTKIDSALAEKKLKRHSPLKAALFSAVIPGLGQAYNKRYWKIPIIYAGFGGLGYALYFTSSNFYGYRDAYRYNLANPNALRPAEYNGFSDVADLKDHRDTFKKNMDITAICTGLWYLLVAVDAAVDAHLMEWNMKDDLSVGWQPMVMPPTPNGGTAALGVKLTVGF